MFVAKTKEIEKWLTVSTDKMDPIIGIRNKKKQREQMNLLSYFKSDFTNRMRVVNLNIVKKNELKCNS